MLDQMIRRAFEQMAGSDQPPARVSITHAIRRARVQRRRQALTAAGAPVLAAGAVVAIGLAGVIGLTGRAQAPAGGSTAGTAAAPRYFSLLRPYAAFGWLPDGTSLSQTRDGLGQDALLLWGRMDTHTQLAIYAAGRCKVSGHTLRCNVAGQPIASQALGGLVGDVDGHRAYWASEHLSIGVSPSLARRTLHLTAGALCWQYARGGWAVLDAPNLRDALRMAVSIRIGPDVSPPVRFALQLTGVPADWQVNAVAAGWRDGILYATSYQITVGRADIGPEGDPSQPATPSVQIGPGSKGACPQAEPSTVINGYPVRLWGPNETWADPELCAPDADGLFVWIQVSPRPIISPAEMFGHHLRLLGPDPAHWTTQPIG